MNHLNLEQGIGLKENHESPGTYNVSNQIKFKSSMLGSNLGDYRDPNILFSGTITISGAGADDVEKRADENNKEVMFQNCAPVAYCISEINNTEIVHVKDIDVLKPMYSLI